MTKESDEFFESLKGTCVMCDLDMGNDEIVCDDCWEYAMEVAGLSVETEDA